MYYYNRIYNTYKKFGVNYNVYFFKIIILSFISVIAELLGISNLIILITSISSPEYYDAVINKFSDYLQFQRTTVEYYFTINNLIFFCFIFYIIRFSISIWIEYLMHKYVAQLKRKLSLAIVKKNLFSEYSFAMAQEKDELIRNIYIEVNRFIAISTFLIRWVAEVILLTFLICGLLFINFKLIIVLSAFLITFYLIHSIFLKKFLVSMGTERSYYEKKVFEIIQYVVSGLKEIRVNNLTNRFTKIYERYFNFLTQNLVKIYFANAIIRPVVEFIFIMGVLSVLFYLVNFSLNPVSELVFFSLALIRIYPSANKIMYYRTEIYIPEVVLKFLEDATKIKEDISLQKLSNEKLWLGEKYRKEINNLEFNNKISLKDVTFKYPNADTNILKNINVEIQKNSIFLIQGKSGAGKTTLINIIMGLLKPTNGKIIIDGNNEINGLGDWKDQLSHLSQNLIIFDSSLEDNITLFQEKNNIDKKLYNQAIDFSMSKDLEKKFLASKEKINRIDNFFSGGEKQRISIARALYFNKPILILDEPTSMLDSFNRDKFLDNLKIIKKNKTIIIISHNEKLRNIADNILDLKTNENL